MKLLYLSVKLYLYGAYCDLCVGLCTCFTKRFVLKNRELNKKLLINMSNFSQKNLKHWKDIEQEFIRLKLEKESF